MPKTNPQADDYFRDAPTWRQEMAYLRRIALGCGLTEEWKWRQPCYTFEGNNVAIIGAFKEYCALSFFKGALVKDPRGVLSKPGENTQAARLVRFTETGAIEKLEPVLKDLIREAIAVEQAGLKVDFKAKHEFVIPDELQLKFDEMPVLQTAFEALTPGRRSAYILFFNAAKQSKTRTARIEKYVQRILDGKGINDCTCGLSKKMPGCDGSHKSLGSS